MSVEEADGGYKSHCPEGHVRIVTPRKAASNYAACELATAGDSGKNTAKTVPLLPDVVRLATRIDPPCFCTVP